MVGACALSEKAERLADIPREVWGETLFADDARIRDILTQRKVGMEQYFTGSGHAASVARAGSYFSRASKASSLMGGLDYFLFLKELLGNWEARKQGLCDILGNLATRIFTADEVTVSFIGSAEDRKRFWAAGDDLGLRHAGTGVAAHALELPEPIPVNEGFVIPSNVSYVARAFAPSAADPGERGVWAVATRALTYDYLWNEVRVKGGAYGTGFKHTSENLREFWSFRDPHVDETLARYDAAAAWLSEWKPTAEEFDGYVVSTVASHDAPVKPRALARRQVWRPEARLARRDPPPGAWVHRRAGARPCRGAGRPDPVRRLRLWRPRGPRGGRRGPQALRARGRVGLPAAHDDRGTLRLGTLDVLVQRNAYGRQLGSFRTEGKVAGIGLVPMTLIHEAFLAL